MVPDSPVDGTENPSLDIQQELQHAQGILYQRAQAVWFRTGDQHIVPFDAGSGWYDLASLTKPLVTGILGTRAMTSGLLQPDSLIVNLLPEMDWRRAGLAVDSISWSDLLSHQAGWIPFDHSALPSTPLLTSADQIAFIETRLDRWFVPRQRGTTVYSDIGYWLAGLILERLFAAPLDDIWQRTVGADSGLEVSFARGGNPPAAARRNKPDSASNDQWINNDPLARLVDGVAGHAGLWGTASGLTSLLLWLCHPDNPWMTSVASTPFWSDPCADHNSHRFTLGCDRPTDSPRVPTTAGQEAPSDTVGHLGYTGCSFWLSRQLGGGSILLTDHYRYPANRLSLNHLRRVIHGGGWSFLKGEYS